MLLIKLAINLTYRNLNSSYAKALRDFATEVLFCIKLFVPPKWASLILAAFRVKGDGDAQRAQRSTAKRGATQNEP